MVKCIGDKKFKDIFNTKKYIIIQLIAYTIFTELNPSTPVSFYKLFYCIFTTVHSAFNR